eukprot:scaffold319996_cov18-Prasinocladus_malaysianus.AAC.1
MAACMSRAGNLSRLIIDQRPLAGPAKSRPPIVQVSSTRSLCTTHNTSGTVGGALPCPLSAGTS